MINLMVANFQNYKKYTVDKLKLDISAQVENSLDLGWQPEDIFVFGNFDYQYMKVKVRKIELNNFCMTGSKMFAVKYLFEKFLNRSPEEAIWAHDLDAWQNVWFDEPCYREIGVMQYSRPKFNGGSIFWKASAIDIINDIVRVISEEKAPKEEPVLDRILKSDQYKNRVDIINPSYNVGCSGFVERYIWSRKPIRVCHFHPMNRLAWKTFALDKHKIGCSVITPRLRRLLERSYRNA